jgi:tryptophan 2,3-dioxygenase
MADDYGKSQLTYNQYLKVPELLKLQRCLSDPPSHDELQFIIVHQAYELWFKLMLFEIDSIMKNMNQGDVRTATWLFRRVNAIAKLLIDQIHILESMSPLDFLEFRGKLNPASGFQSVQFRELEFVSNIKDAAIMTHLKSDPETLAKLEKRFNEPTLWDAFLEVLKKNGFQIPEDRNSEALAKELARLHKEGQKHYDLFTLAEEMMTYDEYIGLWRHHHVRMVERMIGNKMGTGGSQGVKYLSTTLTKKCFPELWDARTHLE